MLANWGFLSSIRHSKTSVYLLPPVSPLMALQVKFPVCAQVLTHMIALLVTQVRQQYVSRKVRVPGWLQSSWMLHLLAPNPGLVLQLNLQLNRAINLISQLSMCERMCEWTCEQVSVCMCECASVCPFVWLGWVAWALLVESLPLPLSSLTLVAVQVYTVCLFVKLTKSCLGRISWSRQASLCACPLYHTLCAGPVSSPAARSLGPGTGIFQEGGCHVCGPGSRWNHELDRV